MKKKEKAEKVVTSDTFMADARSFQEEVHKFSTYVINLEELSARTEGELRAEIGAHANTREILAQVRQEVVELNRQLTELGDMPERLLKGEELEAWEERLAEQDQDMQTKQEKLSKREEQSDVKKLRRRKKELQEDLKQERRDNNELAKLVLEYREEIAQSHREIESLRSLLRMKIDSSGANTFTIQGMIAARDVIFSLLGRGIELTPEEQVQLDRSNAAMNKVLQPAPDTTVEVKELPPA